MVGTGALGRVVSRNRCAVLPALCAARHIAVRPTAIVERFGRRIRSIAVGASLWRKIVRATLTCRRQIIGWARKHATHVLQLLLPIRYDLLTSL